MQERSQAQGAVHSQIVRVQPRQLARTGRVLIVVARGVIFCPEALSVEAVVVVIHVALARDASRQFRMPVTRSCLPSCSHPHPDPTWIVPMRARTSGCNLMPRRAALLRKARLPSSTFTCLKEFRLWDALTASCITTAAMPH